jgi:hypothetical protein
VKLTKGTVANVRFCQSCLVELSSMVSEAGRLTMPKKSGHEPTIPPGAEEWEQHFRIVKDSLRLHVLPAFLDAELQRVATTRAALYRTMWQNLAFACDYEADRPKYNLALRNAEAWRMWVTR